MLAPMIPIPRDWFDYTNFGVGLVGLVFTLWAVRQATGAKQAAKETREAIWQREASDSFSDLLHIAESISELVQFERQPEAAVRVRDILARIPKDRARFERYLGSDSAKLLALESRYQELARKLAEPAVWDDSDARRVATDAALGASRDLSEICGRLLKRQDEEGR
ncbi:EAP30/Vps36 family vacuolar-sorting protein [Acidicapsa acidisoli]|uniref:EAP30/Vps36 family vacuolar-sorting protein n=1 Tax=Acidicapsa acidisoli TaxID=1615681 RepID=UPI0021E0A926|nr:EAP30/Vps36 family vacuolar-sorting protein [Acidicapsa acidisoli]